jgi:VWFA-related protein
MRRIGLAFVVASTAGLAADQAVPRDNQQPAMPPTLRASVEQVVVDVVVTDASGAVARGLTAADFEIRDDGTPQPIVTFSEVVLPFERRAPGAAAPPPAEIRSNRAMAEGRVYLLLLDDLFVSAGRTPGVQQLARDFIGRYVQPGDLVAVATTGGMAGTAQAFTEDMALVSRAIGRFTGKKPRSTAVEKLEQAYLARELDPQRIRRPGNANSNTINRDRDNKVLGIMAIDDDVLDRGRLALRTMKGAVQSLGGVGGRRKTVVYLSEGLDIPMGVGDTSEISTEVHAILAQAARANVAIYAVSPRGLQGMGDEMTQLRALPTGSTGPIGPNYTLTEIRQEQMAASTMLRTVAEGTGGRAAVDANQLGTALDRIVAESSHYYLLGYTPPNGRRDGKYRPIEVRLRKPGLHASARRGYTAPDDREPKPEPLRGLPPELGTLLRQPLPSAGLALAAHAVAFPTATDNVSVTVEIGPGALAFAPKGEKRFNALDVAILPVDGAGRTHGLTQGHPQLTLAAEMADAVATKGLRLSHRLTLAPGEYQLRIGVRESGGGAAGSVLCDLVVPDPAAPGLAMTAIVASASSAITVPSAYNDPGLLWALGGPPTTARAFDTDDTLSAYIELIDAGATAIRDVDILTVVRDARGRDVVRSPQPKANGRVAAGRSFAYAVDLPLKALAPGRYVLRIEARASGLPEPLARELTFDVRTPGP